MQMMDPKTLNTSTPAMDKKEAVCEELCQSTGTFKIVNKVLSL